MNRRNSDNHSPNTKPLDSLHCLGLPETAVKSGLCLAASVQASAADVMTDVNASPKQQNLAQFLPILPPLDLEMENEIAAELQGNVDDNLILKEECHDDDTRPSIKTIQWSNDVITNIRGTDDDFDVDDDLSLYIGAENHKTHPLIHQDERPYQDLSTISFSDVAIIVNDPEKGSIFPVWLHTVVSSFWHSDSITWLPHGRAFAITNMVKFFEGVIPSCGYSYSYEQFMELIAAYGFQHAGYLNRTRSVVFYHEKFLHYRPWIAFTMKPGGDIISRQQQSAHHTQEVLRCFYQIPRLQDILVPYSTLVSASYEVSAKEQDRVECDVAHAYVPKLPAYIHCPHCHCRALAY